MLAAFRAGRVRTLVATDIAARGIDVEGISHVVNYDLPNIPESYVHRIGRTARAGADGVAISFCDGEERAYLRDIEKLIRMSIPATDGRSDRRSAPQPRQTARRVPARRNGRTAIATTATTSSMAASRKVSGTRAASRPTARTAEPQRQTSRPPQQHRNEQSAVAHNGDIGSVAFMQQPRRGNRRHGVDARIAALTPSEKQTWPRKSCSNSTAP